MKTNHDIHVVAVVKGDERYIVLYDADSRAEALRTVGRWAGNVDLSFTWYDAAMMSVKIKAEQEKSKLLACGGRETIR